MVEDFRPKFLAGTTMARKAADAAIGATKKALVGMARKHGRIVHLVHPAQTTMECASCGARTKPRGSGRAGRVVIPARRGMASHASDRHERRPSGLA
ncbi:hypothetical protein GCM10009579_12130 [Streptomyces javensis]|uniref:Transposase n=1 Tax=Streptomyces javensis TaxID=114698 RepID=A0ABN1WNI2_9ACTN